MSNLIHTNHSLWSFAGELDEEDHKQNWIRFCRTGVCLPSGITGDADHCIFSDSDGHSLTIIDLTTGEARPLAGKGRPGFADGNLNDAMFCAPSGVSLDPSTGNVFVADSNNHVIRLVTKDSVSTFAGSGVKDHKDGHVTEAQFFCPCGVAFDKRTNSLFVTDTDNHCIRKISIKEGHVSTFCGCPGESGLMDGLGRYARFCYPYGIAMHPDGSLIVADTANHSIRKVSTAGVVSTVAGDGNRGFFDGHAARFNWPRGVAVDADGTVVYVSDWVNHAIRKVRLSDGFVSTMCGDGQIGCVDGPESRLNHPYGLFYCERGILIVADQGSHRLRAALLDRLPYEKVVKTNHSELQRDLSKLILGNETLSDLQLIRPPRLPLSRRTSSELMS